MDPDAANAEFSAPAMREWAAHVEHVMRGLAHALNNRAAALSAILELSREPDDDPEATRSILATELQRVRELSEAARVLGPATEGADALSTEDLVPDVCELLRLHAELRDRTVEISAAGAPPVRARRRMLQRALFVLCASAPASDAATRTLRVVIAAEGECLVARVLPPPDGRVPASAFVAEAARAMGGEAVPGGFRLPTLAALRQREGR